MPIPLEKAWKLKLIQNQSVEERRIDQKPLAELTFYNPKDMKAETPKIKFKAGETTKNPKQTNENTNIFSFTFNRHKYSTPSPGGQNKRWIQGIGAAAY